ncbi:probable cytochrome P450 9f2 [Sitodiplosis mosellana]|uniref:probable cytochrome P450 9f2 n=1 Tax=Sitodiplosis mosellana TaxID=263140 RepID=UPI002444E617|nr:probable cytochrome P450 9f2 [Sitodiplosis mosellana]
MIGILLLLSAILLIVYAFYKWATLNNDYFERQNLKYMKPTFLVGNTGGAFANKYTPAEFLDMIFQAFPDERIFGFFDFRAPKFAIRDPELVKEIAITSFDNFQDHEGVVDEHIDKLWGNSLLLMRGEKWRNMRATLSPVFTGSKMRQMFDLNSECIDNVVRHLLQKAEKGEKIDIEMKDFFTRYTNDVIASCAYGIKVNSFEEPNNEFYKNGLEMFDFTSIRKIIKILIIMQLPAVARALKIPVVDANVAKIFRDIISDTMEVRKKNNIYRPYMINMLMQIREGTLTHQTGKGKEKDKGKEGFATVEESDIGKLSVNRSLNDDEIVAQCFIFFLAGFDTTSTTLTFASYELSVNPDVQSKLYKEIAETNEKLAGKRVTYDILQKMPYMDQVISETLRKWPPLPVMDRLCVKDYDYNDGNGLKFKIEKGTAVLIAIYGFHHDPKYFFDPEKFDPERFSEENKHNIQPGTYLAFGIEPRNCIGSRFALMEIKAILYYLLLDFSFEPNEKSQIPLKLKKSSFNMRAEKGVHLELKPRKK